MPGWPSCAAHIRSVRKARERLGLPEEARGEYALERLVGPEGITAAELAAFIQQCIRCAARQGVLQH